MRAFLIAIFTVTAVAGASAQDIDPTIHPHGRAFWLSDPLHASPGSPSWDRGETAAPYSMRYTDEVAERLGVRNGQAEFFSQNLSNGGEPGATLVGKADGNGPWLILRW